MVRDDKEGKIVDAGRVKGKIVGKEKKNCWMKNICLKIEKRNVMGVREKVREGKRKERMENGRSTGAWQKQKYMKKKRQK